MRPVGEEGIVMDTVIQLVLIGTLILLFLITLALSRVQQKIKIVQDQGDIILAHAAEVLLLGAKLQAENNRYRVLYGDLPKENESESPSR